MVSQSDHHHDTKNVDQRTAKEKEIDDWLPITSSREAKWWYSAFHNVTAMVGAGVLSLPSAMSELGWGPGIAALVISWVVTLWQMVEMHEMVPGRRFDRYHELGQYAFGKKLGLYIVVPQQLIVQVGVDIVYMVIGGKSLQKFHYLVCTKDCKDIRLTYTLLLPCSLAFVSPFSVVFFGGFAFAPTTYFLPCIMWLAIYKPKKFSLSWVTNWVDSILTHVHLDSLNLTKPYT